MREKGFQALSKKKASSLFKSMHLMHYVDYLVGK